ncbi:serine/arginine repetitive matrix protein, ER lumen protein retaining receptor [Histoplasma ohiense]|nr:serine/arginine repetitive matrix protein, ER lumen protein retaining receptor [Histoplasma ohiense (nom. inval.)]
MDRDRDRRYDDGRRFGESYRPSERNRRHSPRGDTRYVRSPPPRARSPLRPAADTWAPDRGRPRSRSPVVFRRRSRSPLFRGRDQVSSYNPRSRRPSPARDIRRSPPRPRRSRSPPRYTRERSPLPLKRTRDPSPLNNYHPRSPKRERVASPPVRPRFERPWSPSFPGYPRGPPRARSRSLDRREPRREVPAERSWRRRSLSPPRAPSGHNSDRVSTSTSRRSSPPLQTNDRLNMPRSGRVTRSPVNIPTRTQYEARQPVTSPARPTRSPPRPVEPPRAPAGRPPSPPKEPTTRGPSPKLQDKPLRQSPGGGNERVESQSQNARPPGPSGTSGGVGPSSLGNQNVAQAPRIPSQPQTFNKPRSVTPLSSPSTAQPPTGPQARGTNLSLLSAPTRPRGGLPHSSTRDGPSPRDGSWSGSVRHHSPPVHHKTPSGHRAGSNYESHRPPLFRHSSASTPHSYPRPPRSTNYLSGIPQIVPGGKLLPSSLDPSREKRLAQLELDKEKLLEQIEEKQKAKRAGLREWEKLSRESSTGALRSELAEGHLQRMTEGDGLGGPAF